MHQRIKSLTQNNFSIGLELPLDGDWSAQGQVNRRADKRPFGVPDMTAHAGLATLADELGFSALWLRDVPVYDPSFGDAAQVFEIFTYLGFLAGVTKRILLGTAAVVLPIRDPVFTLKMVATVDALSQNRLLLGVASGDRPVEYPIFEKDFDARGQAFRDIVTLLRQGPASVLPATIELFPHLQPQALLVAGLAQQTPDWAGIHMDGWLAYPGVAEDHVRRSARWRDVAGPDKPYISFMHLDLDENPAAPLERLRFGCRVGRQGLIDEIASLKAAGLQHLGLQLRHSRRPVAEILHELSEFVLPQFHPA